MTDTHTDSTQSCCQEGGAKRQCCGGGCSSEMTCQDSKECKEGECPCCKEGEEGSKTCSVED